MKKARLRFSTEIVRRLGEELNPSLDKGVIELVKNAFDADATKCRIELKNADKPGGSVVVTDNGYGMTVEEIENGWLVLGESAKSSKKTTPKGRVPAGSKGLGRLAALRMGKSVLLSTRPRRETNVEHNLLIDWVKFDNIKIIDDVELTVVTSRREKPYKFGTNISIEDLKSGFTRSSVKRLARELILLADPFNTDPEGFRPELLAPEFADLESLVEGRYFQDAELHLSAEVDSKGFARAKVTDWKGDDLFTATHDDITKRRRKDTYRCLPVTFDLWVFILNDQTFSTRKSTIAEVRDWLREFGGVHIYYNGLRVSPYGSPGNDWLEMNLRRARSPEERPSTNTSIGRVDLLDTNDYLVQKTDRSGFIEDEMFSEIRSFAQDSMTWMANRRLAVAEKRRIANREAAPQETTKAKQILEEAIENAPTEARVKISNAFTSYEKQHSKEVDLLKKEIQLYRTLSTAGITAVTFAHESRGNPLKVISRSIDAISRRAKVNFVEKYTKSFARPVESIKRAVKSLSVLGTATLKLVDHEKRRVSRVNLHDVLKDTLKTYRPFFRGRDVKVQMHLGDGNPYLRGSEAAIESIVTNLLNNSLAAFEDDGTTDRLIKISTTVTYDRWTLTVEDNGPGIQGIGKSEIWLPGRTTRRNGTGLGLTIVRDAVMDLGGVVDAKVIGDLGGAVVTIELPILGA